MFLDESLLFMNEYAKEEVAPDRQKCRIKTEECKET